jgi:hypothetical protein
LEKWVGSLADDGARVLNKQQKAQLHRHHMLLCGNNQVNIVKQFGCHAEQQHDGATMYGGVFLLESKVRGETGWSG